MKKLGKIFACLAFACFSIMGLAACDINEVKDNTTAAVESATSVVAVEYSQTLAREVFAAATANMNDTSYTLITESTSYDDTSMVTSYDVVNMTVYKTKGKSTLVVEREHEYDDIKYTGKTIFTRIQNAEGEDVNYFIETYTSNEVEPDVVKSYTESPTMVGVTPITFSHLLPYVTSGMCYIDGISYVNIEYVEYGAKQLVSLKIKNGQLLEVIINTVDENTYMTQIFQKLTFNYDVPEMPTFPQTAQELIAAGYVEGSAGEIINDKFN